MRAEVGGLERLREVRGRNMFRILPGGRIVGLETRGRGLRGCLGNVGSVPRLPKTVFMMSPEGRGVTVRRTRELNVPMFNVISAGYSPRRLSCTVPKGSSTVETIGLVANTVTGTVVRTERNTRRRMRTRRRWWGGLVMEISLAVGGVCV